MGQDVCGACGREIRAGARTCRHCGVAQSRPARRFGPIRRNEIVIHASISVFVGSLAAIAAGLIGRQLNADDTAVSTAAVACGIIGLMLGSLLGARMAEEFSKP